MFLRFWKANLWKREDGTWLARIRDVLTNHEENVPEVGKYNAGQKFVFWAMSILIVILISSGLVVWDQYFSELHDGRTEARRHACAFHCGGCDHRRLDHPLLLGDLGARHNPAP